jgi:hypothetical protein
LPDAQIFASRSYGVHAGQVNDELEVEGQAFSWAQDGTRSIFTMDRRKHLVRRIEMPAVTPADSNSAQSFR